MNIKRTASLSGCALLLSGGGALLSAAVPVWSQVTSGPFVNTTILPTDTTSWGGQLGLVRSKKKEMQAPPDLSAWLFHGQAQAVERDNRFSFTGVWSYFGVIDSFLSMIENKVPALQKVSGELKTPCTTIPQNMPAVPELPSPEKVGKAPPPATQARQPWRAVAARAGSAGANKAAEQGRLTFSHNWPAYASGPAGQNQTIIVGMPGTLALARSSCEVLMKSGRAYLSNGSADRDLLVESGRVRMVMPPGSAGIVDTAPNGWTRYMALVGSPRQPVVVSDACGTNAELGRLEAGQMLTVAQEDAVAEDLVPASLLAETIEKGAREEGYLVVKGMFSLKDALDKDPVLSASRFGADPWLRERLAEVSRSADAHPWQPGDKKVLTAAVKADEAGMRSNAAFMPTRGARCIPLSANELMVSDGAVLLRGGDKPVVVSCEVNRQKVMVEVKSGALIMVSALDGRATVLNLTDSAPGSCTLLLPSMEKVIPYQSVAVESGQVAEFYVNDGLEPASTVLSYRTIARKNLAGGVAVLIAKYDYLAAMKRFNLSFALPSQDLNRVIKTMAASATLSGARAGQ